MQDYAVVKIGSKQLIVEPGGTYEAENFAGEAGEKQVLMVLARGKGEAIELGKPTLPTKVEIEIIEQAKGEKVQARLFKAKSRYRRVRGHRKLVTRFKVLSIK